MDIHSGVCKTQNRLIYTSLRNFVGGCRCDRLLLFGKRSAQDDHVRCGQDNVEAGDGVEAVDVHGGVSRGATNFPVARLVPRAEDDVSVELVVARVVAVAGSAGVVSAAIRAGGPEDAES